MKIDSRQGIAAPLPGGLTPPASRRGSWSRDMRVPFAALLALSASWAFATARFGSPDEVAHVAKAAGVVRGQLFGQTIDRMPHVVRNFRIPVSLVERPPECFATNPLQPADCQTALPSRRGIDMVPSSAGTYPPIYYALVGLPSLTIRRSAGIYAMRTVSAIICAALLALAFAQAARDTPHPESVVAGVMLAVTPMALFLAGMVNPSGLEIAAAIAAWVAVLSSGSIKIHQPPTAPARNGSSSNGASARSSATVARACGVASRSGRV